MRTLASKSVPTMVLTLLGCAALVPTSAAATLEVGPGKTFQRIEDANAQARPGDAILIYPLDGGRAYEKTAVYVRQPRLTLRGVPSAGSRWVKISGEGFDYSGLGSTPRAIFQFNRGTDHCLLEGLELADAHNGSDNGAGVRISAANHVTIRNCSIHDNDMGIMSGGDGSPQGALDQRIESCEIHHNGNNRSPGYNHNLYLGGASVTLRFCDVHHSLTGHDVKSRAHQTHVEYCYIHDSLNREFDLVDARETAQPESHAVLMGNVIVKDPQGRGNRTVIHFGQDGGGEHDGTLHLVFNTVVTPFIGPLVELSAPKAKAMLLGNLVCDGGVRQSEQVIAACRGGASPANVSGKYNWFSGDFRGVGAAGGGLSRFSPGENGTVPFPPFPNLDPKTNVLRRASGPIFVAPAEHNYRLTPEAARTILRMVPAAVDLTADQIVVPRLAGTAEADEERPLAWQYRHPLGREKRPPESRLTVGAYAESAKPDSGKSRSVSSSLESPRVATRGLGGEGNRHAPPLTYPAITDGLARPEPPLPAFGPAGSIVVDPTFGSRVLRVTDGNTKPNQSGWSFVTSAGGFINAWNCESNMFWVLGPGGAIPYAFDPTAMRVRRLGDPNSPGGGLSLPRHGPFSYRKPNVMYCANGLVVEEYDFRTGRFSPVFDAAKLRPELTTSVKRPYGYAPSASDDDQRVAFAFGGIQDEYPYVAIYDRRVGTSHVLDTAGSRLDGRPTRTKLGWGIHSVYLDRSGRFVVIGKGQGRKAGASEWLVWDTQANDRGGDVADIAVRWSGHEVSGFGWRINQSGYYGGQPAFYDQTFWAIRRLELDKLSEIRDLIAPEQIPLPHPGAIDGHLSWHNARSDVLVPVIQSIARDSTSKLAWRAWDNEIIGIRTDGVAKTVWRFAHHRSVWDGGTGSFWDTPRGNVSPDGRWFLFTSNWGKSLGADREPGAGSARRDVFLVDLCSAHAEGGTQQAFSPR